MVAVPNLVLVKVRAPFASTVTISVSELLYAIVPVTPSVVHCAVGAVKSFNSPPTKVNALLS